VLYVTERAVFELAPGGLVLRELAPGIAAATQVLPLMEFVPTMGELSAMPALCLVDS
jgi:propionate CoA-transferase